jgi:hypothetical protein
MSTSRKERAMDTAHLKQELLDCERRYWQAIKDRDVAAAVQLTDFPCIVTGAQGVGRVEEAAFTAMLANPPYVIHDVDLADGVQVRLIAEDVAIVAYRVHEELTVDGERVELDANDSSTWVRRDGRWRCALHTEAIAGDPFGRDRAS